MPGTAQVIAGCETMYLRKNCAQDWQSNSLAHSGNFLPCTALNKRPATEGQIDHHRHAAIGRQRNDALAGVAVIQSVIDLNEVESLLLHRLLELAVLIIE